MRKLFLVVLTTLLLAIPAVGAAHDVEGVSTGRAQLAPFDESGIQGVINFTDDGTTLTTNGTATGMDPDDVYISLIYDNKSRPGGPLACEPMIFDSGDPDFILPTMFIGEWSVDPAGNGTLTAINTNGGADYVSLDKIKTISIRALSIGFERVACGNEATHPAG
jgi:hypothetical protein